MSIESALAPSHLATDVASAVGCSVSDLRRGDSGQIAGIDPQLEMATARRLVDLGFVPGAQVTVLRRAPLGDPVILRVAGYEVALRKAQTTSIRVRPLP